MGNEWCSEDGGLGGDLADDSGIAVRVLRKGPDLAGVGVGIGVGGAGRCCC